MSGGSFEGEMFRGRMEDGDALVVQYECRHLGAVLVHSEDINIVFTSVFYKQSRNATA